MADTTNSNQPSIDWISRHSGYGSLSEAAANALIGINHRGVGNPIPYNTDNHGLTFFTRPNMNLSYDNLATDRVLTPLMTQNPLTYQRAIRTLLDPEGAFSRDVKTPLVDERSPFMAILSNHLVSLSGWPDPVAAYFSAKDGPYKETWSMIDDVTKNFGSFDLQASFRNIAGDPITLMFEIWRRYATLAYNGTIMPYPVCIAENEIDYQTAIYRLVLDPSRQYVQKIARTIAFPTSSGLGAAMNYSNDRPFSQDNAEQIQIPFHCIGAEYQDPILVAEFNDIVQIFNRDLTDDKRASGYQKLAVSELSYFNYYGYPRIDPDTHELEWWVAKEDYALLTQGAS